MNESKPTDNRKALRRKEDRLLHEKNIKNKEIFYIGQIITSVVDFDRLFKVIIEQVNKIMEVERCSIFLLDEQNDVLNAFASAGLDDLPIHVPKNKGIVGWVFNNRIAAIVNDVNNDTRFYPEIDKLSKRKTNNILCVPLINKRNECTGALEIINKIKGEFTSDDEKTLINLANYIAIALENASLIDGMRRKEHELRESEEKYRTIVQSIVDGYFEVDLAGNLQFFNDSMIRILGYSRHEMTGMNNRQYMTPQTARLVYDTFNKVYVTGEPTKAFGWELIRKDGEIRYVETSVSLIRNSGSVPIGFRGIARDISELRAFEKAKERVVNHLSHELGTPLCIIDAAVDRLPKELEKGNVAKATAISKRVRRNVGRLKELQDIIDDMISERPVNPKDKILPIIEGALTLLEVTRDEKDRHEQAALIQGLISQLESLVWFHELHTEEILIETFLDEICVEASRFMGEREVSILQRHEKDLWLQMDRSVLRKACVGILRNAVENTPDEGLIEVRSRSENDHAVIEFQDFGVGITLPNQKMIFSGFFHTQETSKYSSKEPYFFNAGGWGSDLLRTRVLSERFGFSIDFSSTRCPFLPGDQDECSGRISTCRFIKNRDECLLSGGTSFSLQFPLEKFKP